MSQITMMMGSTFDEFADEILNIAAKQILTNFHVTESLEGWADDAVLDNEGLAKIWAVKILVNRLRIVTDSELAPDLMEQVKEVLATLVENDGDLLNSGETPEHHCFEAPSPSCSAASQTLDHPSLQEHCHS